MSDNKTKPTDVSAQTFLESVSESRRQEAYILIELMSNISRVKPVMWGPSIIGFGSHHYSYETGRQGDMPRLSFSPRKTAITIYFDKGFNEHGAQLAKLGKHKTSISCLYINKLTDININVLQQMLEDSYKQGGKALAKPTTVDEFIARIPAVALPKFTELRRLVKSELPHATEVLSYGILGYKIDDKRARVFISGWKDHVSVYPVPKDKALQTQLKPYIKGRGSIWFKLDELLPIELTIATVKALAR